MTHLSHTLQTIISNKKSTGFTLIEMLVSLVIVAIIVASVYTAFDCGKNAWQVGETIVQKNQNARGALDFMSREISAMCLTVSSIYEIGLVYDSVSFRFFASIPENDGDWDLCKVSYRYDAGDKEIERSFLTSSTSGANYTTLQHPTGAGHGWEPMVFNINSLGFRWWDESGSQFTGDTWDSTDSSKALQYKKLPKAVEIRITAQDDKQLADEQTFRTVVYIPGSEQ